MALTIKRYGIGLELDRLQFHEKGNFFKDTWQRDRMSNRDGMSDRKKERERVKNQISWQVITMKNCNQKPHMFYCISTE